jgi:HEAT repeat protein
MAKKTEGDRSRAGRPRSAEPATRRAGRPDLGGAIIGLLESGQVELRAAAATVLAAVGKGDAAVETALTGRLGDSDAVVRRIALEALVDMGAGGIAPRLVPLLRSDDSTLVERAHELLSQHAAEAEATLRKEVAVGPVPARRVMAQLLLRRGTKAAVDAVLDQLADAELGEQALQLVRAELDKPGADKLANVIDASAVARAGDASKALAAAWTAAQRAREPAGKPGKGAAGKGAAGKGAAGKGTAGKGAGKGAAGKGAASEATASHGAGGNGDASKGAAGGKAASSNGVAAAGQGAAGQGAAGAVDLLRDPDVAQGVVALGALLRLIGYLARPDNQALLLRYAAGEQPRPIRLAAIAGLRRIVAHGEGKGTEKVIEVMIDLAGSDDALVAQAAVDTLRGARIPESLAKPFAALARSQNVAAQKLAMERLPAGGGAGPIKALIEALGGDDPTARDAAGRGLAKAPEAVLPTTRALLAATDEQIARRYAGVLRSHRGHVSNQAIDELVDRVRDDMERHARGKATADQIVLERVVAELIADLAPARHVELLFERARKLRKAGKSVEAFGSLKPLLRSRADIDTAIDDEQRFLLAVLALEAAGDSLLRTARTDDPVFEQFARLAGKGFPVARRLAREQDVSDESIYALGFRLLESTVAGHEDLGAELLQGIIEERPRSKLAKAARNKLKLTGHLDDE